MNCVKSMLMDIYIRYSQVTNPLLRSSVQIIVAVLFTSIADPSSKILDY